MKLDKASGAREPAIQIEAGVVDCPSCGAPMRGRPICGHDGTLAGRFTISGRYTVEERLGAGGCAFVYGARHCVLGNPVAIKVLRPDLAADAVQAARFLREARAASQLAHDHLVTITDFGHDEALGLLYLVMPRLTGGSLADLIAASAPVPAPRAVAILRQIARAVAAAHAVGVTHRDLNPRNVLLSDPSGEIVKVCDVGLSRQDRAGDRVSAQGALIGTTAYMAPEQLRTEATADAEVDVYGFGATAYHLLTGRLPIDGPTPVARMMRKLHERDVPPLGGDLPPELDRLIRRCLAFEPRDRPASMDEVQRGLAAAADATPPSGLIGQVIGGYRVVRSLGDAGDAAAYLGEHPQIGAQRVIKVLPPERVASPALCDRFVHEAQIASVLAIQLGRAPVPTYVDAGRTASGQPYVVLTPPIGETIAELLARRRPEVDEVRAIVRAAARALAAVHGAGIVHRDLKPASLAIARDRGDVDVEVLDFGVAKRTGDQERDGAAAIVGTAAYCAPEQALGGEVGPAADVYALGAILFEMLTGSPPFRGEPLEVLARKTAADPPPIGSLRPELPAALRACVDGMLAREPARRHASMGDVIAALAPDDDADAGDEVLPATRSWSRPAAIAAAAFAAGAIIAIVVRGAFAAPPAGDHAPAPALAREASPAPAPTAAPPPHALGLVDPWPSEQRAQPTPPAPARAKPAPTTARTARTTAGTATAPAHRDDGIIADPWK